VSKAEKLADLAVRRGFYWPSSEIYGGVGGFYDYGPLGVLLKENIVKLWREVFIKPYQDLIVEVETPIIMPSRVFEASGHVEHFTDYIVECRSCGRKYRADHLIEEELNKRGVGTSVEGLKAEDLSRIIREHNITCPYCGGELGEVQTFNLLFKTTIGPYSDDVGYLRPETAQGMFVAFPRVAELMGRKAPFGVAQVGRVARNEISPRQGLVRLREFSQMEIELFFDPQNPECPYLDDVDGIGLRLIPEKFVGKVDEPIVVSPRDAVREGYVVNEWMAFFMALAQKFVSLLGVPEDKQMFVAKLPHERAHYSYQTYDQVVLTERFGWIEVSGHSYRGDYDLSRHSQYSGRELVLDRKLDKPKVVEDVRVYPNPSRIREVYGDVGKIAKLLQSIDARKLVEELEERGYVEVGGYRVEKDMVFTRVERREVYSERYVPHVVEPSFGVDRLLYVTLEYAYRERDGRIILSIPKYLAPIQVAVFPIVKRREYVEIGRRIYKRLLISGFRVVYDDNDSIGYRYVKADEEGIPYAITIDEKTLEDDTVTVRDRDTWRQVRVKVDELVEVLRRMFEECRYIIFERTH